MKKPSPYSKTFAKNSKNRNGQTPWATVNTTAISPVEPKILERLYRQNPFLIAACPQPQQPMKTLTLRLLSFCVLFAFGYDAHSATILYAMTRNGFLYSSLDGAKSWQSIAIPGAPAPATPPDSTGSSASPRIPSLQLDPETATTLYSKQGNLISDLGPGGGVYVSTDAGNSGSCSLVMGGPA
jgi:hypothetical protein